MAIILVVAAGPAFGDALPGPVTAPGPFCAATIDTLDLATREAVDALVYSFESDGNTPGVELAIQIKGKTVYECGYGEIKKGSGTAPTPDTRFQIDSLTKVFTAMSVLKMVEDGTIDLDAHMGTYLSQPNTDWETIPVRDYLAMSTGIHDGSTTTGNYQTVIDSMAKLALDFTPAGSEYEYSDTNYFILGNLIRDYSPENDYNSYATDTILTPLGMSDTGLIAFKSGSLWATPYLKGVETTPRPPDAGFSGGGFVSTMHDLEKFGTAIYNREILSASTYAEMWKAIVLTGSGKVSPYALGWDVGFDTTGTLTRVSKNGGGWGWGSQMNVYPTTNVTIILLCNGSSAVDVLAGKINGAL